MSTGAAGVTGAAGTAEAAGAAGAARAARLAESAAVKYAFFRSRCLLQWLKIFAGVFRNFWTTAAHNIAVSRMNTCMNSQTSSLEQLQQENGDLKREIAMLRAEKELVKTYSQCDPPLYICCSTPLSEHYYVSVRTNETEESPHWNSWCPCCRRPLEISISKPRRTQKQLEPGETLPFSRCSSSYENDTVNDLRYAYVATVWGNNPGFILGALVLGHALKKTSAAGLERVLLYTDDVGQGARECLQLVWNLRSCKYLAASDRCFVGGNGGRFAGTFTKLNAISLYEYDKILLLDLDLIVLESLDHLFELPAPAALARGANDRPHGMKLDGRAFFLGETIDNSDERCWAWGQGTGINAGVVLLEPNERIYNRMCSEIDQDLHPEHTPSAGPEQDYLSRFYAPYWTHISVKYNYQLHHILYNLESVLQWWPDEPYREWLPARLKITVDDIAVIHFSGTLKIWDREYLSTGLPLQSDEDFAKRILRNCNERCYQYWVQRAAQPEEYEYYNIVLQMLEDGKRHFRTIRGS